MAYLNLKLFLAVSVLASVCYTQEVDKSLEKKPADLEKPHEEAWSIPNFDDLLLLFESEDPSAFRDAVGKSQGSDAPALEELPGISNDLMAGNLPKYLSDRKFTTFNTTGNYSYSNDSNEGEFSGVMYGLHEKDGTSGSFSAFAFNHIRSEFGTVGTILFSRIQYCIRGDHVTWQGYTQGSFLWMLPTGLFVPYGSYVGSTESIFTLDSKPEHFSQTLGIMDIDSYYSKTVTTANGDVAETRYDMYSVTGGTNGTLHSSSTISEENDFFINTKVKLFNSDKEVASDSFTKISSAEKFDNHDQFSEANMSCMIMGMHATVGLYLP